MSTSTLVKVGVVALAALAAKTTYSAISRRSEDKRRQPLLPLANAGKPADAFSTNAIQHDLSADDAI